MSTKAGYDPIPDIKKAEGGKAPLGPEDRYPGANPEEADLLSTLDSIIDGSRLELDLPKVAPDDVTTRSPNFCLALALPLVFTFALCAAAAYIGTGATDGIVDPNITDSYFPYFAAVILWLVSTVPISNRMTGQASFAIVSAGKAREMVDQCVENDINSVNDRVVDVQDKLNNVLGGLRKKLPEATKIEKSLKKVDPTIDIPDLSDAERALDSATDDINTGATKVKEAAKAEEFVPEYLRSTTTFRWKVVFPVLLICLALQLVWTYVFTVYLDGMLSLPDQITNDMRLLADASEGSLDINAEEEMKEVVEETEELIAQAWSNILVVVDSFFLAFFQVCIVYLFTGAASVARMANDASASITESTKRVAREQGLYAATESVLGDKMSIVKTELLKTILCIKKIEECQDKLSSNTAVAKAEPRHVLAAVPKKETSSFGLGRLFGSGKK